MGKYREKAAALVAQMTLEEKVSQTLYNAPAIERLGIPAYNWWSEALHGVARAGTATVFPQAIGVAATFDEELTGKMAEVIATEARAKYNVQSKYEDRDIYKGLTFWSPNVNIFRDPRWGRGQETYGEDPYLTSRMGVRFVQGMQQEEGGYMKTAACAKHFAVHSGPEGLRHGFDAVVSKQDLYETYLPAFKACVQEAGVEAIMGAYNRTNGEPCCGSKTLLLDILRDEWGFEGHVVSDCWAIRDFHENHKVTKSPVESAAMAMNNGCDVNCGCMYPYLYDAVKGGYVEEERLDEALTNLMECRMKLGILGAETEVPFDKYTYDMVDTKEHKALNLEISKKSLVLLKNDGLLPLNKDKLKSIAVIGPNADSKKALVGNYEGTASQYITVLDGIQEFVGDDVRVYYSNGCELVRDRTSNLTLAADRMSEVRAVCEVSDVIVVVLGLDADIEGEEGDAGNDFAGGDKKNLEFPGLQPEVMRWVYESGKPIVLVSMTGSAMSFENESKMANAILQAWYPGSQGGRAIAQTIFGACSPEGKLPVTCYKTSEELPEFTDYNMKGKTYRYMEQEAQYPFGYGLSYTNFEMKECKVTEVSCTSESLPALSVNKDGKLCVSAVIENVGKYPCGQTLQVYVKALREGTPNAQLKGLKKVFLQPGEAAEVSVSLGAEAFALYDEDANFVVETGEYEISIGMQQPDTRSEQLTGQKVTRYKVTSQETFVL